MTYLIPPMPGLAKAIPAKLKIFFSTY